MSAEYRTHDFEHNSESGMGDVALLLGWTLPPDDDGFWYREPHGPVHDGDLRPLLVEELAALATMRDRAKATMLKIVCVEEPDDGVVLLSSDSPTHFDDEGREIYDHDHFSPLGDGLIELWNILNGPKDGDA